MNFQDTVTKEKNVESFVRVCAKSVNILNSII